MTIQNDIYYLWILILMYFLFKRQELSIFCSSFNLFETTKLLNHYQGPLYSTLGVLGTLIFKIQRENPEEWHCACVIAYCSYGRMVRTSRPGHLAQSVACPTEDSEILSSIPGSATYHVLSWKLIMKSFFGHFPPFH